MFADVGLSTEAIVVVGALLTALAGTVTLLYTQLTTSNDARLKEMTSQRDSYQEIAIEAIAALELKVNKDTKAGKEEFKPIAPVVAEHNSPTTEKQRDTAALQTIRARLVAVTLLAGLPAREAAIAAVETV